MTVGARSGDDRRDPGPVEVRLIPAAGHAAHTRKAVHVHGRPPANFSLIDFRLHIPAYAWHLIISPRDPAHPTRDRSR
jgi:hypothetical protein